jgi:hypothetical protein
VMEIEAISDDIESFDHNLPVTFRGCLASVLR